MSDVVVIEPTQTLAALDRERSSRGFVYVIADRFGSRFVVAQNLKRAIEWLNENAGPEEEPIKPSALYEAASVRTGLPYRHRWRILRLDLPDAVPIIAKERALRCYDRTVVVGAPKAYRVH